MGDFYLNRLLRPGIQRAIEQNDEVAREIRARIPQADHEHRIAKARERIERAATEVLAAHDELDEYLTISASSAIFLRNTARQLEETARDLAPYKEGRPWKVREW